MSTSSPSAPLRVLEVIDTDGPGGAETVFLEIVKHLRDEGVRVRPVVPGTGRWLLTELGAEGLDALAIPTSWPKVRPFDFAYVRQLRRELRRFQPDVVHAHSHDSALYAAVSLMLAGSRAPLIATFHGASDIRARRRLSDLKWWLLRRAALVVGVSDSLVSLATDSGKIPRDRLVRIHNGIDTSLFAPRRQTRLRQDLGIPEGTFLIGAVGNIRRDKGYEYLIRAVELLKARGVPVVALVAGENENQLTATLLESAAKRGVGEQVRFLGFVPDVPSFLNGLDLYVLCSSSEGFSLAVAEALGVGLPVVSTRCGGPEEIVEHGVSGVLVPKDDHVALADALAALYRDPAARSRLSASARERAVSEFSVSEMVARYRALYLRLAGGA